MSSWKNIEVNGIGKIEKIVGEFEVYSNKTPYGNFRVRVTESKNGYFMGFTNIKIKSKLDGSPEGGVGNGGSVGEALEDTLKNLIDIINEREDLKDDDFVYVGYDEF